MVGSILLGCNAIVLVSKIFHMLSNLSNPLLLGVGTNEGLLRFIVILVVVVVPCMNSNNVFMFFVCRLPMSFIVDCLSDHLMYSPL